MTLKYRDSAPFKCFSCDCHETERRQLVIRMEWFRKPMQTYIKNLRHPEHVGSTWNHARNLSYNVLTELSELETKEDIPSAI